MDTPDKQSITQSKEIFIAADSHRISANVLTRYTDRIVDRGEEKTFLMPVLIGTIVLGALSTELYIKCLRAYFEGTPPYGHDLWKLYKLLPQEAKARIKAIHSELMTISPKAKAARKANHRIKEDIQEILIEGSDAFIDWRYFHEKTIRELAGFRLGEVNLALRRYILELHPEWEDAALQVKFNELSKFETS